MKLNGVTAVHIGLAASVERRSLRKASLNNRPGRIEFDAVALIEGIATQHLRDSAGQIENLVSQEKGCVGSHTMGIYELSYFLPRPEG